MTRILTGFYFLLDPRQSALSAFKKMALKLSEFFSEFDGVNAYCGFSDKLKTAALRSAQKLQAE